MASNYSTINFGDIFIRQSQNTARLSFEVQFTAVKRRLDTELNAKKTIYNEMDKTLEPILADMKRQRAAIEKERAAMTSYLENGRRNINKLTDAITQLLPQLNNASSDVGPTAAADFDRLRDRANQVLKGLVPNSSLENGLYDRASKIKSSTNPSGVGDYLSYAGIPDRAAAVGIFVSSVKDSYEVNPLSTGFGRALGQLRYGIVQDFDLAKAKQEIATKKLTEIDKAIEKKDAEERLVVLKEVQTMENRNEQVLRSLSLNFEFSQSNTEIFADRSSFLKPQKGSIMNLFI